MNDKKNNPSRKNDLEDKGKLEEMNDSSAEENEGKTSTAEDEGTLGKMNGEA